MKKPRKVFSALSILLLALCGCTTAAPEIPSAPPASAAPSSPSSSSFPSPYSVPIPSQPYNFPFFSPVFPPATWVKSDYDMRNLFNYDLYYDGTISNLKRDAFIRTKDGKEIEVSVSVAGTEAFGMSLFPLGKENITPSTPVRVYLTWEVSDRASNLPTVKSIVPLADLKEFENKLEVVRSPFIDNPSIYSVRNAEEAIRRVLVEVLPQYQKVYFTGVHLAYVTKDKTPPYPLAKDYYYVEPCFPRWEEYYTTRQDQYLYFEVYCYHLLDSNFFYGERWAVYPDGRCFLLYKPEEWIPVPINVFD